MWSPGPEMKLQQFPLFLLEETLHCEVIVIALLFIYLFFYKGILNYCVLLLLKPAG